MIARVPLRVALVLLLLGGCGPDPVDGLRMRNQRVIFGGPSGFDLEEMTAAVPRFTGDQQRIGWEQTATLRGTARFQPFLSFGSVNIAEEGSGQLAGGNLAFTANHVAEPTAAPILTRTARFDADRYPWVRKNLEEGCVPFEPPPDNPAEMPNPSVDDWYTKLRLKALGLQGRLDDEVEELADLEIWEYETVREWGAPTDTGVACASDSECRSPDGAVCRDYDEDGTRTCTVRAESDIALVRFKEKAIDTQGGIPGFILSGPGAIFDYQLPQTLIDGADTAGLPREIQNRDRSTLYHVNAGIGCLTLDDLSNAAKMPGKSGDLTKAGRSTGLAQARGRIFAPRRCFGTIAPARVRAICMANHLQAAPARSGDRPEERSPPCEVG